MNGLESSTRRIRASLPDFLNFLIPLTKPGSGSLRSERL